MRHDNALYKFNIDIDITHSRYNLRIFFIFNKFIMPPFHFYEMKETRKDVKYETVRPVVERLRRRQ